MLFIANFSKSSKISKILMIFSDLIGRTLRLSLCFPLPGYGIKSRYGKNLTASGEQSPWK